MSRLRVAGCGFTVAVMMLVASAVAPVARAEDNAPNGQGQGLSHETLAQLDQMDAAMDAAAQVLHPGEIRNFPAADIARVAIGNPEIIDVTIVSSNEVLLQAKKAGRTNLILWDSQGKQQASSVNVVDPQQGEHEAMLRQAMDDMGLEGIQLKREGDMLLVTGQAQTQDDFDRLQRLLDTVDGTHNLVAVRPAPPAAPDPLIKLTVQLIEMNRSDLNQLGVKWDQELGFTNPALTDATLKEALTRWGTGIARTQLKATLAALIQTNRARLLAEPKLVTTSGKEASTFVGVEVPIIDATSSGATTGTITTSITFRNTGVTLTMTPTLIDDRRISTVIEAEASDIDSSVALNVPVAGSSIAVPGFQVRKANSVVTNTSGETVLIAGLLKSEDSHVINEVPGLGRAPIIGRLFRSPKIEWKQRELIIAVTPELVIDSQMGDNQAFAVEQALARPITTAVNDPTLRYALEVQDRIAAALRYPNNGMPFPAKSQVLLKLHLLRDGRLAEASVSRSSGFESFDRAALDAAKSQAPYAVFPHELGQPELWLELPVVFSP